MLAQQREVTYLFQQMTNVIDNSIQIPGNCQIGDFNKIYPGVTFGNHVHIADYCVLGNPSSANGGHTKGVHIPDGSNIRSHTVIYDGSEFGERLETGHHVVIREGTVAGENLRVGNYSDVEGDCQIGDFCRFHGYVHVGKGSIIGDFVWLFSLVTLTNDPMPPSHIRENVTIEDGVVVCVGSTVFPGAHIGRGTLIAAETPVRGTIPPASLFSAGQVVMPISRLRSLEHHLQLPWMNHFSDAYPDSAQNRLIKLKSAIMADVNSKTERDK